MEIIIDDPLIKKMLRDKVINPNLVEKDQVLKLLEYLFSQNPTGLKQLVYLLLSVDPVNNYQIGDSVRVHIDTINSWQSDYIKRATVNAPDQEDCITGVVSHISPFADFPYTVIFRYTYKEKDDELKQKSFSTDFREKDFVEKTANARPILDL